MTGKRIVVKGPRPSFEEMIRSIGPLEPERSRELSEVILRWLAEKYPERAEEFKRRAAEQLAIEDRVREERHDA